ncbi:hypothetical protein M011DRAFT_479148 [Sporormia fimetaria CBS 119925]|uniref:Uncharacterized protein n=1 Tax=Sporormia fimetaria CBS 119925 TaxID=1340428 RepID=A0A6A6V843_9PLEO|nr:hypothetical protein M011DRAFT_479148 [Sporormia fimetaria CBS 119925]
MATSQYAALPTPSPTPTPQPQPPSMLQQLLDEINGVQTPQPTLGSSRRTLTNLKRSPKAVTATASRTLAPGGGNIQVQKRTAGSRYTGKENVRAVSAQQPVSTPEKKKRLRLVTHGPLTSPRPAKSPRKYAEGDTITTTLSNPTPSGRSRQHRVSSATGALEIFEDVETPNNAPTTTVIAPPAVAVTPLRAKYPPTPASTPTPAKTYRVTSVFKTPRRSVWIECDSSPAATPPFAKPLHLIDTDKSIYLEAHGDD